MTQQFPQGYLAVQFSHHSWEHGSQDNLIRELEAVAQELQCGIVLFRAGAAAHHDRLEPYELLVSRWTVPVQIFHSLHIWELCALVAGARCFVGTSLHGRIVATAWGVPRMFLPLVPNAKVNEHISMWDQPMLPYHTQSWENFRTRLMSAEQMDRQVLQAHSDHMVRLCRHFVQRWISFIDRG